jgi:hypothetical protein
MRTCGTKKKWRMVILSCWKHDSGTLTQYSFRNKNVSDSTCRLETFLIPPAIFQYLQCPLMGGQKSHLYFLIYALLTTVDSGHSCDESERHRKRINPRNPFLSPHVHAWACMVDRRIIKLIWILLVKIEDLSSIFRFCVSRLNKNGKKNTRHKKSNAVKQSS